MERMSALVAAVQLRCERQIVESSLALRARSDGAGEGARDATGLRLTVDGVPVLDFVQRFRWNESRWDHREPLPHLAKRLKEAADAIDGDLRSYVNAFVERKQELAVAQRRLGGNLLSASLEERVTPRMLSEAGATFENGEFLLTEFVVLPRSGEEDFLSKYERLDCESVPVGDAEDREGERTSPVVPRSARRVTEDGDGLVLYSVVILRQFQESFRAACKAKRWTVRDASGWDPTKAQTAAARAADLEVRMRSSLTELNEQSRRLFGEATTILLHLSSIRAFVEAVLRFGLPPRFVFAILHPKEGHAQRVIQRIKDKFKHLADEDDDETPLRGIPGIATTDSRVPGIPLPCFGFNLKPEAAT